MVWGYKTEAEHQGFFFCQITFLWFDKDVNKLYILRGGNEKK